MDLTLLNWLGTLVFAATGALLAVKMDFDIMGVLILAAITAIGGGSLRDIVVGTMPPTSLTDEPLLWAIAVVALLVFFLHEHVNEGRLLYALDTLGLAVFAALGAERGISAGLGMWGVIFTGAVSGVGGGMLRDLLSGQIPVILYRNGDFYASAAALGSLVVFLLHGVSPRGSLLIGIAVTIVVRLGLRQLGVRVPTPKKPPSEPS